MIPTIDEAIAKYFITYRYCMEKKTIKKNTQILSDEKFKIRFMFFFFFLTLINDISDNIINNILKC